MNVTFAKRVVFFSGVRIVRFSGGAGNFNGSGFFIRERTFVPDSSPQFVPREDEIRIRVLILVKT